MQAQPYCLKDGWIRNSDTGKPVARVDTFYNTNRPTTIVFPNHGAIMLDNVQFILDQIHKDEAPHKNGRKVS